MLDCTLCRILVHLTKCISFPSNRVLPTYLTTMTIKKMIFPALVCIFALGCSSSETRESSAREMPSLASLPHLTQSGTDYPYIRYSESTGKVASRGRAFFLYPIKERKTEILALEYSPG